MTSSHFQSPAAPAAGQCDGTLAQFDGPIRRRGAQLKNVNAMRHGRRSRRAELQRAETAVTLKAARWVLRQIGGVQGRCRPKPVRLGQLPHLDAEARHLLDALGVPIA
jgi:hypothetical protein